MSCTDNYRMSCDDFNFSKYECLCEGCEKDKTRSYLSLCRDCKEIILKIISEYKKKCE